jgi:DNA polymerase-3 subunit delta'
MAKRTKKKAPTKRTLKSDAIAAPIEAPIPMERIIGQEQAIGVLQRAMQSERIHHAWIFHGPEGVGKFTAALSWASILLDPTSAPGLGGTIAPDPDSHVQQLLRAGTHPDLHVIRKELARYSDDRSVRNQKLATIPKAIVQEHLIEPAGLAPTLRNGSMIGKVFIVDEAELLDRSPTNAPVQNALLKTLEEPAPGTVILLVTSSEDRLLPTIRSRCQRVGFHPIDDGAMRQWISTSGIEASPEDHQWLLRYANGSPGRYKHAFDGGFARWHNAIDPLCAQCDRGQHAVGLGSLMTELVDSWAQSWVKAGEKIKENRSKDAANRAGANLMFAVLAERYRSGLSDPKRVEQSLRAIDAIERAKRELDTNVQMRFVMDHLAAGLSAQQRVLV